MYTNHRFPDTFSVGIVAALLVTGMFDNPLGRDRAGAAARLGKSLRSWRLLLQVNDKRSGRRWLADELCIRLRAERRNRVWSCGFVEDRSHDGRQHRMPASAPSVNIVGPFWG